ncbi:alpha/beta hydrolase [Muricauda sp. MAR_2010_75]|uniref:alpha/beta hydrolase n=1 Tax=Allomuricauda sp. MAR_2010_75 TaxID=1250232 RepID=UPI001E35631C|nr:alpha/beta hydrolase [Muricauda sp. MAR_2010_75]
MPTKLPEDHVYTFNAEFEELFLSAPDGARLNALKFYAENPKGLILYFHGNAGDLSRWGRIVVPFTDLGYDVLIMDYRTYGKSTGKLSEKALYADAQLFYDRALEKYAAQDIIIYGRSLGASIATHLASNNNPKKLILETPFYSLQETAQERFPFLPTKQLLKYKMPSFKFIQKVSRPIRIFHGTKDNVVSYESGKKLFESILHDHKKMYTIEDGGHNNLSDFETYWEGIRKELR